MEITLLGTGTSHGVPVIGCECSVCRSNDPRNKRMRCSAYITVDGVNLLIDTPPDLRTQVLREGIRDVDVVLFTHAHADHIFGLDDIRRFNKMSGVPMRCFGNSQALGVIRKVFDYAFGDVKIGGGIPQLELMEADGRLDVDGVSILPVPVEHGRFKVLGYRIGGFAYVTDCNFISDESLEKLQGLELLVLGVLRPDKRTTHFSLQEGLEVVEKLKPSRAVFTHTSHRMDYETISAALPANIELGYDGIRLTCENT